MLYLSIAALIVALILFILAFQQKKKAGLPSGRVIYVDASQWMKVEKPLFNREIRLAGKPDYLVRKGKHVIPIEVKSGKAPHPARPWHVAQLAAYCLLVESEYGVRPPYGILNYADQALSIGYSATLESSTRAMIKEMQERTSELQIERSHRDQDRCFHCGYRSMCDQALRI